MKHFAMSVAGIGTIAAFVVLVIAVGGWLPELIVLVFGFLLMMAIEAMK